MADLRAEIVATLNEPYREYWAELGQFIHYFSDIERGMQSLLRTIAGVSDPIGAALFSGIKVDGAMGLINRACEATERGELQSRLKPIFDQLGAINGVRNNVVHWGAQEDNGELIVTNAYLAATPDRVRTFPISSRDLQLMIIDLIKIRMHLALEEADERRETISNELRQRLFNRVLASAWRYKPPQQSPPKKPSPQKPQKRSRPPDA